MFFRKTVEKAFSLAVIGCSLSGVAVGQVAGTDLTDGAIVRPDTNAAANAATPAVDAATSANVNAKGITNPVAGAQVDGINGSVDAAARVNGQNINSDVQSNTNAGVNALQNRANVSQNSDVTANTNPFGATFDSGTSDRIIIQNLQPNSAASRLGLQAGDRIVDFNGQAYTDVSQFNRDLVQLNGNTDVPITYERNGQRFTQRFRMSGQQANGSLTYGNPRSNTQSGSFGQISYSANRPSYGVSPSNGYTGDMYQNQGYVGVNGHGSVSGYTSACCGESVHTQQCCSVTRHHRGGRRHRSHCR